MSPSHGASPRRRRRLQRPRSMRSSRRRLRRWWPASEGDAPQATLPPVPPARSVRFDGGLALGGGSDAPPLGRRPGS